MGQAIDFDPSLKRNKTSPSPVPYSQKSKSLLNHLENNNYPFSLENETKGSRLDYRLLFDSISEGVILYDLTLGQVIDANQAACAMHGYTRDEFIGLPSSSFLHPESAEKFSEIAALILKGQSFTTISTNLYRDGTPFLVELLYKSYPLEERTYLLGIMRHKDAYIQFMQDNKIDLENRLRQQTSLLEFARQVSDSLEFDANLVLEQMKAILPFDEAVLYRLNEESLIPLGAIQNEATVELITLKNLDVFEAIWGSRDAVRLRHDADQDDAGNRDVIYQCGLPNALNQMQSQIWIPLSKKGRIHGCLGLGRSEADAYHDQHVELAQKIAALVVNALMNADLHSQAQATAAIEERRTLARSLHDAVNQSLFSAGLIAEVLPHVWEKNQEEGRRSLEDLRRLTRGAQAEIRMMLVDLRPSALIDVEISDLLHLLANAFLGRTNIPVEEDVAKDISLPSQIQTAYYHFCQEALNNILKHAKATQVWITFGKKDDKYVLCIKDNGIGFDRRRKGIKRERKGFDKKTREEYLGFNPKYVPPGHYGLRMMDELAGSVGADLCIETRPGQGTSISILWKNTSEKEGINP